MSFPKEILERKESYLWEIPRTFRGDMRVPARVYATETMLGEIAMDRSLEQLVNVATLPGIEGYAVALPDVHEGYGFPVGGVAAFDREAGIISPGGIGYDINCGVRLLVSSLEKADIEAKQHDLGRTLFAEIPSGVGRGGRLKLTGNDFDLVLSEGAKRIIELGYAAEGDLEHIESGGRLASADPAAISEHAKRRGSDQLGTIGAGNHFVEAGYVETVIDESGASSLGLRKNQAYVLIHTGSRGLGHQVATDHIRAMVHKLPTYGFVLPDRELACAPFRSAEGQAYWAAMSAAANFAWANRELIAMEVRNAWKLVFGEARSELRTVYDVAHNIAKEEEYEIGGAKKKLIVHRKGATRAFPGQPVIIPGSMGTSSYVLLGTEKSLSASFGSSCHGAGRRMSRTRARKETSAAKLRDELALQGIIVNAGSKRGLVEEAPSAYKDVDEVVGVIHEAGIASKVARLRPLVVVKG